MSENILLSDDIPITLDDFLSIDLSNILEQIEDRKHSLYWTQLSQYAQKEYNEGNIKKSKILGLLSAVASMKLSAPETLNPYTCCFSFPSNHTRGFIPDDFSEQNLDFFKLIITYVDDIFLKGRLADILWIRRKKSEYQTALTAIDCYIKSPINSSEGYDRVWRRAIALSRSINEKKSKEKIKHILWERFESAIFEDKAFVYLYADVLFKLHLSTEEINQIVQKLDTFADVFVEKKEWLLATNYYNRIIDIFRHSQDKQVVFYIKLAETYIRQAEHANEASSAGSFYESALHTYRRIPRKFRDEYNIEDKIKSMHNQMNQANKASLLQMSTIEVPFKITLDIEASRQAIQGKELVDALISLSLIHTAMPVEIIRKHAKNLIFNNPFMSLCSMKYLNSDGLVTRQESGIDLANLDSESSQKAIELKMYESYKFQLSIIIREKIIPAYEVFVLEHHLSEGDLLGLCQNSNNVPKGRERFWAKGLYHGFNGDFATAVHLLSPQIEHLIREKLKLCGEKTTTLDDNGVETENGLSSLLEKPLIKEVLDENYLFEFKALLTESAGFNLRNELAHGLLNDDYIDSYPFVYLWWFALHTVMNQHPIMHEYVMRDINIDKEKK